MLVTAGEARSGRPRSARLDATARHASPAAYRGVGPRRYGRLDQSATCLSPALIGAAMRVSDGDGTSLRVLGGSGTPLSASPYVFSDCETNGKREFGLS